MRRAANLRTAAGQPCLTAFDRVNPQAVRWAERRSAGLVTEVAAETRAALRQIVARAFTEGIPPRQAARLIRDVVGLRTDQMDAVANLFGRINAAAEQAAQAGRPIVVRYGESRVLVPARGLGQDRTARLLSRYADRLRKQRALLIARTETIAASNAGQQELWRQAVENGLLRGTEQQQWSATASACPICAGIDGQQVPLGEMFSTSEGPVSGPPAHPACRCALVLVTVAARRAARDALGLDEHAAPG